jgi:hypothetical protein
MSRLITGTLEIRFIDRIKQDIIEHRNDSEYDVIYLTPVPGSRHNFRLQVQNFASLDFDNPSQWSQDLLTDYCHMNFYTPLGEPFVVTQVCKPSCDRQHLTHERYRSANSLVQPPL